MRTRKGGTDTLIIFIAILFTAATTGMVIIQTAQTTQQKALNTGGQAVHQVSTGVQVLSIYGSDGRANLQNLTIALRLDAGSDRIAFDGLSVTLVTGNTSTLYRYAAGPFTVDPVAQTGTYSMTYVQHGSGSVDGFIVRGDMVEMTLEAPRKLIDGEKVALSVLPLNGLPSGPSFYIPDITTTAHVALYP